MTVRLEILDEEGEWRVVPGIASVDFHPTGPDVTDEEWRRHDARDALHYLMTGFEEIRRPTVIDQDGNPVRPCPDRPAWQSPYGPPSRHH
ncbi:hypothetical protein [Streptomyces sp. NPDC056948]|uniref:hypothetical protein n=1 Tax=Streptomyces sp. NPDC056948 TaxID=3345975 RepID=UPI00362721D5